jgi:hypothetical protein
LFRIIVSGQLKTQTIKASTPRAFFMPGSRNRPYLNDIQPADNCFEQIKLGSDPLDIFG